MRICSLDLSAAQRSHHDPACSAGISPAMSSMKKGIGRYRTNTQLLRSGTPRPPSAILMLPTVLLFHVSACLLFMKAVFYRNRAVDSTVNADIYRIRRRVRIFLTEDFLQRSFLRHNQLGNRSKRPRDNNFDREESFGGMIGNAKFDTMTASGFRYNNAFSAFEGWCWQDLISPACYGFFPCSLSTRCISSPSSSTV